MLLPFIIFHSWSRSCWLPERMIDVTSRWECLSFTYMATAYWKYPPIQMSKGIWGSSPWLESGTELELRGYGEMVASRDLEGSMSAWRWRRLEVGEEKRNPGFLRHVCYARNWYYKAIKLVDVMKNECGRFKRTPCVKKVIMRTLNKMTVRGRVESNHWKYKAKKGNRIWGHPSTSQLRWMTQSRSLCSALDSYTQLLWTHPVWKSNQNLKVNWAIKE